MDLELDVSINEFFEVLKRLGFKYINIRAHELEAKKYTKYGRLHVLARELSDRKLYVDIHWDFIIHFLMLGTDYSKRPKELCCQVIKEVKKMSRSFRVIGGYNWFSRRNKALIRGLRL